MIIVHTEASGGWGGQEVRILTEAAAMRERGHTVFIAARPGSEIVKRHGGSESGIIPFAFGGRCDPFSAIRLARLLRETNADVVNTHSSIDSWHGAMATRFGRGPVLVRTRHLSIPVGRNPVSSWLYTRPRAVVATGQALRERLIAHNRLAARSVISIATGIDLRRFDPVRYDRARVRRQLGVRDGEPLVGMVAMMRGMKGHRYLVEAMPRVLRSVTRARFVIVGDALDDNPLPRELKQRAEELGLADRARFTGFRDDIPELLSALDLMVLPSVSDEGVPQSLSQAMAMGVPVVSTPVGAIAELVEDGVTGLLVPPRDVAALGAAIVRQLLDRADASRMARAARRRVEDRYSLALMAARTEALYDRLISGGDAWPEPERPSRSTSASASTSIMMRAFSSSNLRFASPLPSRPSGASNLDERLDADPSAPVAAEKSGMRTGAGT